MRISTCKLFLIGTWAAALFLACGTINGRVQANPGVPTGVALAAVYDESSSNFPISDAAAAAKVVPSSWEPRPQNATANRTTPTEAELARVVALPNLNSDTAIVHRVSGSYTGTTDEILQWGAAKWGFSPDLVRAIAVNESKWNQSVEGDCTHDNRFCVGSGRRENGDSWGILQVKQSSYRIPARMPDGRPCQDPGNGTNADTGCYPLSHLSTAFNVDYKLMWQRACMNKSLFYLNRQNPIAGHAKYADATGDELLWGCVGAWFHGWYVAPDTLDYIGNVQRIMANRDWTKPGF